MVVLTERAVLGCGDVPRWVVLVPGVAAAVLGMWSTKSESGSEASWTLACCCASCTLALGVSGVAAARGKAFSRELATTPISAWTLEVVSDGTQTAYGVRYRAHATRAGKASGNVWLVSREAFARGEALRVVGRFALAGDDERGVADRRQGVWGSVRAIRVVSRRDIGGRRSWPLAVRDLGRRALDPQKSPARALMAGCVLADREELRAQGLDELFSLCGVAHLVAVSGAHIATVAGIVTALVEGLGLMPAARLCLTLALTGAFVLVCGAPPSAVRAWIMSALAAGATVLGRRTDGLSAVSIAGLGMCLVDPYVSGQLGFLLSVSCVVTLCLFARYASYAFEVVAPCPRLPRAVPPELRRRALRAWSTCLASLSASLVCQMASAPLCIPTFGRISLIGPLASLVVAMPVMGMMVAGVCGACLAWAPPLSQALLLVGDVCANLVIATLRTLAKVPLASLPIDAPAAALWAAVVLVSTVVLVFWPRVERGTLVGALGVAIALILATFVRWRLFAPARICVLDVGQGDAILVQDGAAALLVDCGPDEAVVLALLRNHVVHLDAVVITHLHDDHYGGLDDLVGTVACDRVVVAEGVSSYVPDELMSTIVALSGKPCEEVAYGDRLLVGAFELRVVWPREPVDGTENSHSMEMVMRRFDERRFTGLLTGDAERDETGEVILRGDVGDIDFLKVGHHGSEVSLTEEEAHALDPEIAVASAGEGNSYGHPRDECIDMLEAVGARFLCTKDVGDVELRPGPEGLVVRCQKSPP